jgi:hypothetical protein
MPPVPTKTKPKTTRPRPRPQPAVPRRHHLDRRAHQILAADNGGDGDELLTTPQVAQWFGTSEQWLEIGRTRGYGPSFVMLAARTIRYRRSDCRKYIAARVHASTAEYRK